MNIYHFLYYLFVSVIQIVLLNLNTEDVTIFKCQHWLSKSEEDGKLVRELAAEIDGQKTVEGMFDCYQYPSLGKDE